MGIWGLLSDLVIMSLLGATIFYAIRLSKNLEHFRQTRDDMNSVVGELSAHVARAQAAVEELRSHAGQSAINLQTLISRASEIADELELMNQAGDALAARLEGLASKASAHSEKHGRAEPANFATGPNFFAHDEDDRHAPDDESANDFAATLRQSNTRAQQVAPAARVAAAPEKPYRPAESGAGYGAFSIRDREYEDSDTQVATAPAEWEEDDPILSLSSQAERELAAVLRRRRGQ